MKESLCSATFDPKPWNIASPGLLYERLEATYPEDPQEQHSSNFTVSPDAVSFGQEARRYVYRDDQGRLLIASPDLVSVNSVVSNFDYEGWEAVQNRFLHGVGAYQTVSGTDLLIRRLVVRYINVIAIPEPEFSLEAYFDIPVPRIEQAANLSGFLIRTESRLTEPDTSLVLTFASVPPHPEAPEGSTSFALDLEVYRDMNRGLTQVDLQRTTSELHEIENRQFESLITDSTRELFR